MIRMRIKTDPVMSQLHELLHYPRFARPTVWRFCRDPSILDISWWTIHIIRDHLQGCTDSGTSIHAWWYAQIKSMWITLVQTPTSVWHTKYCSSQGCVQRSKTYVSHVAFVHSMEPMKPFPIPDRHWQLVSQDLCTLNCISYLVTVCHFSDWLELDMFENTRSCTVIAQNQGTFRKIWHTCCLPHWQWATICQRWVSASFAKELGFRHTTSSPYHSQGNGKAEAAMKIVKSMLRKSRWYWSLRHYYAT